MSTRNKRKKAGKRRKNQRQGRSMVFPRGVKDRTEAGINRLPGGIQMQGNSVQYATLPSSYYKIDRYDDPKSGLRDSVRLQWRGSVGHFVNNSPITTWFTFNTIGATGNALISAGGLDFSVTPRFILPYGSPGNLAFSYTKFLCTKLRFIYHGICPATSSGGIAIIYNGDGAFKPSDVDYDSAMTQPYAAFIPVWSRDAFEITPQLNRKDWFYTDIGAATDDASSRETFQGTTCIYPNPQLVATGAALFDSGFLFTEGEIIFSGLNSWGQNITPAPRLKMPFKARLQLPVPSSCEKEQKSEVDDVDHRESDSDVVEVAPPPALTRQIRLDQKLKDRLSLKAQI